VWSEPCRLTEQGGFHAHTNHITNLSAFAAAALLATACSEAPHRPKADAVGTPLFSTKRVISSGIASTSQRYTRLQRALLVKGFNPTNRTAVMRSSRRSSGWTAEHIDSVADVPDDRTVYTPVQPLHAGRVPRLPMATRWPRTSPRTCRISRSNTDQGQVLAVAATCAAVIDGGLRCRLDGVNVVAWERSRRATGRSGFRLWWFTVSRFDPDWRGRACVRVTISKRGGPIRHRVYAHRAGRRGYGDRGDYAAAGAIGTVDPQCSGPFLLGPPSTWLTSVIGSTRRLHLAFSVQPSRRYRDGHSAAVQLRH